MALTPDALQAPEARETANDGSESAGPRIAGANDLDFDFAKYHRTSQMTEIPLNAALRTTRRLTILVILMWVFRLHGNTIDVL